MTQVRIKDIAGVPLLYDRDPAANYGKKGYPVKPWVDATFAAQIDQMFSQLFLTMQSAGLGSVTQIFYGGISRAKDGSPSYHHSSRAFDLDALRFSSGYIWVADNYPHSSHLYLSIEAVIRQHFGTVLGYGYNEDHTDHIHFDNGESPGFHRLSKSRVLFLQRALHLLFDEPLMIDGVYGPQTRMIETRTRKFLGIGPLTVRANWLAFLGAANEIALDRTDPLPLPEEALT